MKKFAAVLVAALLAACSSAGRMDHSTGTQVTLSHNNYRVIASGIEGSSSGFYLLGFIPIVSPNYADAKAEIYRNIGTNFSGRSVALANQTEDRSFLYLILFGVPTLKMTADIVEFTDEPNVSAPRTNYVPIN